MKLTYKLNDYKGLVKSAKQSIKKKQELTFDEAIALFAYYTKRAIDFFCIDPAWDITLSTDCDEEGACISFTPRYLHARISFNPDYFRTHHSDILKAAVHEVAHIFLGKIHGFIDILPDEYADENHPFNRYYTDAFEEATTRVERIFFKYMGEEDGDSED